MKSYQNSCFYMKLPQMYLDCHHGEESDTDILHLVKVYMNILLSLSTVSLYLWLTELHQLQNISFQAVVFGPGVSEDINEGSRKGNLQGFLYGSYTHLGAVAPTLCDKSAHDQALLEEINYKYLFFVFVWFFWWTWTTLTGFWKGSHHLGHTLRESIFKFNVH